MASVKNTKGLYSVLNDYSKNIDNKNCFTDKNSNEKNSLIVTTKGKNSSLRPGNILSSSGTTINSTNNDHLLETQRLEKDNKQDSFVVNEPQKSYLRKQKSNEKLLLSPLSPSAFSRSTKIRFRCPSVDLIVSPSTASAYSSEDCAEVSVDSWEDESPLDDEYNLLFGEKNEFPLSYSIMDETSELHIAHTEMSESKDVSIKKPMNGHVPHEEEDHGGSRRTSKVEENDTNNSAVSSRRTSKADSFKNGDHEEVHEENKTLENGDNVESYDAIGDETVGDDNKNIDEGGDNEEEPTRKLSTISATSEGDHEESKATAAPDEENKETEEEEIRRVSVTETTAEEDLQEDTGSNHSETNEPGPTEKIENYAEGEAETVEEVKEVKEVTENVEEAESEVVEQDDETEERAEAEAVEDDTVISERGSEPAEVTEVAGHIEELEMKQENGEETEEAKATGDQTEEQHLVNGIEGSETNASEEVAIEMQPVLSLNSSQNKSSNVTRSPRKGFKPASPRHVGGPPLRGRPRGAIRAAVPAQSTNDTRLNQSWNNSVRRTQSQSPGRSTSDDFAKAAKNVDLHSIFGKTEAHLERIKHREEKTQKKRAEEEEKQLAEKEQRRKDAEAAFQSWLRRKAQERRRARSTGRSTTQSQDKTEDDKHKNREEAEQAFQAWVERKKEEQRERKRQLLTASKSQQHLSAREDSNEAFRQWKEQKDQQRREERMLVRTQLRELQSIVPIDKYGDPSRTTRYMNYSFKSQNGLPKLNNFRTISPANRKRVTRSDSLPSIGSPDGAVKVA